MSHSLEKKVKIDGFDKIDSEKRVETFCIEPWRQIHYDSDGRPGPCCNYRKRTSSHGESIESYKISIQNTKIQEGLLSGFALVGCQSCYDHEDQGKISHRQRRNKQFGTDHLNTTVNHLMLTLGNLCNSACRMCNPSRSDKVLKNYQEIVSSSKGQLNEYLLTQIKGAVTNDIWRNSENFNKIAPFLEKISSLEISGGEPTMHPIFSKILDYMVDNQLASNVKISVTTNGTFSENQIKQLLEFKSCHLSISIDGIEDYYSLTRWPLRWRQVTKKLDYIFQNKDFFDYTFILVPMNYNLTNIEKSLVWFMKNGQKTGPRFMFSHLNSKMFYHPSICPTEIKEKFLNDLKKIESLTRNKQELQRLIGLKNEVMHSFDDQYLEEQKNLFIDYTNALDRSRMQNTWNTIGWHF